MVQFFAWNFSRRCGTQTHHMLDGSSLAQKIILLSSCCCHSCCQLGDINGLIHVKFGCANHNIIEYQNSVESKEKMLVTDGVNKNIAIDSRQQHTCIMSLFDYNYQNSFCSPFVIQIVKPQLGLNDNCPSQHEKKKLQRILVLVVNNAIKEITYSLSRPFHHPHPSYSLYSDQERSNMGIIGRHIQNLWQPF